MRKTQHSETFERQIAMDKIRQLFDEAIERASIQVEPLEFLVEMQRYILSDGNAMGKHAWEIHKLIERVSELSRTVTNDQEKLFLIFLVNSRITARRNEIQKETSLKNKGNNIEP